MSTFAGLDGIEESIGPTGYVSAASIGSTIGIVGGLPGMLVGGAIGAVVDVFLSAEAKKDQREQMEKDFYIQLLKRYNTQIFISALERMGPAMVYLSALGLKPGSPEFNEAMKKKLFTEIGYKGDCAIDLYGPAATGHPRPLVATINRSGQLHPYNGDSLVGSRRRKNDLLQIGSGRPVQRRRADHGGRLRVHLEDVELRTRDRPVLQRVRRASLRISRQDRRLHASRRGEPAKLAAAVGLRSGSPPLANRLDYGQLL